MSEAVYTCYSCGATVLPVDGQVGRRDSCDKCGRDLRVCKNCKHFDPKAYNECREPQADRVVDKEKANFCDYFSLGAPGSASGAPSRDDVFKDLDDLFKK